MADDEQHEGEPVEPAEVGLDDLGFDWTESVPFSTDVVEWAMALDIPPHVVGVDYSRSVSQQPDTGGGNVG